MIRKLSTYKLFEVSNKIESDLNEGLIMTHDIDQSLVFIRFFFNNEDLIDQIDSYHVNMDTTGTIILSLNHKMNLDQMLRFQSLINNLGYFISKIKIKQEKTSFEKTYDRWTKFKTEMLSDAELFKIAEYKFFVKAKFDESFKDINVAYHVTDCDKANKILKQGLVPKSYSTLTDHPERVYLSKTLEGAKTYINNKKKVLMIKFKRNDVSDADFTILKIDLEGSDIICYQDPDSKYGIYTYDNIDPKRISIINI